MQRGSCLVAGSGLRTAVCASRVARNSPVLVCTTLACLCHIGLVLMLTHAERWPNRSNDVYCALQRTWCCRFLGLAFNSPVLFTQHGVRACAWIFQAGRFLYSGRFPTTVFPHRSQVCFEGLDHDCTVGPLMEDPTRLGQGPLVSGRFRNFVVVFLGLMAGFPTLPVCVLAVVFLSTENSL